jgi:hypothetical protein
LKFNRRKSRLGVAALGLTVLGAAAATLSANSAMAAGIIAAVTTVSCSVTGANWCISGNDSSSGIGVIGTSKSGTGLRGTSTSQYGLKATSGSNTAIFAQTTSGSSAITALAGSNGNGVNASAGGVGLSGTSTDGGEGVLGYSKSGTGVYGLSTNGAAGEFDSTSGDGIDVSAPSTSGIAVKGISSNGVAAYFQGGNVAIGGRTGTDGFALVLGSSTDGSTLFSVDGHGNVSYNGTLQSLVRTIGGGTSRSFGTDSTQPTIEDTGTAQLVRGAAVVRFDPTFAASIEPSAGYRVFVTPDAETHELFVASKTAAGFVVREAQAGRSTAPFDYRIVATTFGAAGQRMTMLSPAEARTLGSKIRLPAVLAVKLPASLPAPAGETMAP